MGAIVALPRTRPTIGLTTYSSLTLVPLFSVPLVPLLCSEARGS